MKTQETAYAEIGKLVQKFKNLPVRERKTMNEHATRQGFILPMFRALGWDIDNVNEVNPEEKVSRGFVDFSFRIGNVPRYFLETKKLDEDLNKLQWVQQAIDYAWTKSVTWALLSDFEGLIVFNAEAKADNPYQSRFLDFTYEDYLPRFEQLWWLSREQTLLGRLDMEADKFGRINKRLPVSQELFADLKKWRQSLFNDIKAYTMLAEGDVDNAVLHLLNRLIFIRTAEDRLVEPNRLQALVRELKEKKQIRNLAAELSKLFREMDGIYNSELFKPHMSEGLDITPAVLEEVINGLYARNFVRYNFNALEADVLGTVYEQYLGAVVADQSEEEAKPRKGTKQLPLVESGMTVQERRKKRKSQGIYYTPSFVTKYIVQQTVGKYLEEKGYNPSKPPRILDMACGSGSFLIEAFDVVDKFVMNLRTQPPPSLRDTSPKFDGTSVEFGGGQGGGDRARQLEVLTNCIYGVDKDKQALEVARLNLLLRALHSREKLPLLKNFHLGDSLRPETWEMGFPEVMKDGGFDIIIGNPPYVRIQTLDKAEVEFFNQNFESATGNYDIYVLFVEQALKLLKPGGVMGFILPNKFMQVDYGEGLRKLLSENKYVEKIVDFKSFQIFENATTYTCLLFLRKKQNSRFSLVTPVSIEERTVEVFNIPPAEVPTSNLTNKAWTLSDNLTSSLLEKIRSSNAVPLLDLPSDMSRGSSSGGDDLFILTKSSGDRYKTKDDVAVDIESDLLRIPLYATDFGRYVFRPQANERIIFPYQVTADGYKLLDEKEIKKKYPKAFAYLSKRKKELEKRKDYKSWYAFSAPRNLHLHDVAQIVVPLLANKGLFAFLPDDKQDYCLMASGGFSISVLDKDSSPTYVLGLLNSTLLFWYLKQISNVFRGGWITCTKQYVGQLPIRRIDFTNPAEKAAHDEIVSLVEKMLALQKEKQSYTSKLYDDEIQAVERQIAHVDEEINQRVYRLYGLTEEEIGIVEGA
ncbi:MAG: N-6 DNA methylase [Chloroflexi bacterium]|nr:N-6 DNA methylase [Chloroflexota bacterium]